MTTKTRYAVTVSIDELEVGEDGRTISVRPHGVWEQEPIAAGTFGDKGAAVKHAFKLLDVKP